MLQPKFNPFFYGRFIFQTPNAPSNAPDAQPAAPPDFEAKGTAEKTKIEADLQPNSNVAKTLKERTFDTFEDKVLKKDYDGQIDAVLNGVLKDDKYKNLITNFNKSLKNVRNQSQFDQLTTTLKKQVQEIQKEHLKKFIDQLTAERNEVATEVNKHTKLVEEFKRLSGGKDGEFVNAMYPNIGMPKSLDLYKFEDLGYLEDLQNVKDYVRFMEMVVNDVKKYDELTGKSNSLLDSIKSKYVTREELEASPIVTKHNLNSHINSEDFFGNSLAISRWDRSYEISNLIALRSQEIELFEEVLKNLPKYTISPKVSFDNSGDNPKLNVELNGENIPEELKEKIKTEFTEKFNLGFESKYASTASTGDTFSALIKAKLSSLAIPGRIEMDIKDENISRVEFKEKKEGEVVQEPVVVGYASFDSAGNDYERNHELFALGRAEKVAKQNEISKVEGHVVGIDEKGVAIIISNSDDVKKSWENLTNLYNTEFRKEEETSKTINDLRNLVSKYNKGGVGFSAEQKAFFDRYLGQWRKSEIQYRPKAQDGQNPQAGVAYDGIETEVKWA